MTNSDAQVGLPAFMTIERWCEYSGMSRSAVYVAMRDHGLLARKARGRTLIDVAAGLAWLNGLPSYAPRVAA